MACLPLNAPEGVRYILHDAHALVFKVISLRRQCRQLLSLETLGLAFPRLLVLRVCSTVFNHFQTQSDIITFCKYFPRRNPPFRVQSLNKIGILDQRYISFQLVQMLIFQGNVCNSASNLLKKSKYVWVCACKP